MILLSKLQAPAPGCRLLRRSRLLERFDTAVRTPGRVVTVVAPAGFGKTTLAAGWLRESALATQAAWLTLDAADDAPERLLVHMSALFKTRACDNTPHDALITIINALAQSADPRVLILDDVHVLTAQGALWIIDYLINRMPPQLTLVLLCRSSASLRLGRARAAGLVAEFEMADLRFDGADAEALLNGVHGLALDAFDIALLLERTDGWVTGLQLASAALGKLPAVERRTAIQAFDGAHPYVRAYFDEEVWPSQSIEMQRSLLSMAGQRTMKASAASEMHALYLDYVRARARSNTVAHTHPQQVDALSARESEVLALVARGLSNRDIARQICVAPGTVKRHLHNIFSKLNIRNRTEAVAYASMRG